MAEQDRDSTQNSENDKDSNKRNTLAALFEKEDDSCT